MKQLMKYAFQFVVLMACLAPGAGMAGLVGEPAPALIVSGWIKGKPVEIKPGTNIFVLEIWESKFPSCTDAITNLNTIQTRFKTNGVVVVGISDEPVETISDYLQHDGRNIEYTIAADNKKHTSLSYMKPLGQRGIPYAFVVGTNGDLLWHGHPQHGLGDVVEQIVSGRYDEALAKKVDLAHNQMQQYLALARQGSDRTELAGRTLLAARTNDVTLLCDLAYVIASFTKLQTRDFALANEALDYAEKLAPTNSVSVGLTRAIVLFESGKRDEGLARARQILASTQDPVEKTNLQALVNGMESRIKSQQNNTNQTNSSPSGGPAGKP